MKIIITMDIDDVLADPDHPVGVTQEGFDALIEVLGRFGHDIDVKAAA